MQALTKFCDDFTNLSNVRTFIKGSIEARTTSTGRLSREDFVNEDKLGRKRCRIPVAQREVIYSIYEQYQDWLVSEGLWDSCDQITSLLRRIEHVKSSDQTLYEERIRRHKIYLDECQDYIQIEVLLFFMMSGPGSLFLAGDSAQSIVEGTDFRFEEV